MIRRIVVCLLLIAFVYCLYFLERKHVPTYPHALSLKKSKGEYRKPKVHTKEANKRFMACCKDNLPEQCWDACAYDVKLLPTAKRVFVDGDKKKGTPVCDVVENFVTYLKCANGGMDADADNRQCCKDFGINKVCFPFCNPSKSITLSKEQKSCGIKLRDILTCHQYGLEEDDDGGD
uniref:Domain of unknown function DB domain-containing protein n=1 Tax=Romanomermis culicivorax TaxID=13658 RepID=A0A915KS02_ROMCU